MKKGTLLCLIIGFAGSQISPCLSQTKDVDWDVLLIREDHVKPSLTMEYEASLMDLKDYFESRADHNFSYFIHLQDNYYFSHIIPLTSPDKLQEGMLETIVANTKDKTLELIWEDLNSSIETARYYTMDYRPEYSYLPEGDDWLHGVPYRRWNHYYFQPGTEKEVEGLFEAWQYLYQESGVRSGYRIYKGLIGQEQPLYIFATWAADPGEYQDRLQENMERMGMDGAILWMKMMELVRKVETVEGWYLPQYSSYQD
jgi:hypothetical protein